MTRPVVAAAAVFAVFSVFAQPATAQYTQQGPKLVGTGGGVGTQWQGYKVAVSSDGNTAIVGAIHDTSLVGAAWVFVRSNGTWTQQQKLTASDETGAGNVGYSVALSADGNTAAVGGRNDSSGKGAVWVFTRSGGVWTQQGAKLVDPNASLFLEGTGVALSADGNTLASAPAIGNSASIFARSSGNWSLQATLTPNDLVGGSPTFETAALSADGNTLAFGGIGDNSNVGATWVFTRSGTTWTQQGSKLVGSGGSGVQSQGNSVALSSDGNTLATGGPSADGGNGNGRVWVFSRSNGTWTQQGNSLTGSGASNGNFGHSVSLSSDGNTLASGTPNTTNGATFVYTRSNGSWAQQGSALLGTGGSADAEQGYAVALSGDASTLLTGGVFDNSQVGAAWVFAKPAPVVRAVSHDFDHDGHSDILWRDANGNNALWLMNGTAVVSAAVGSLGTTWSIAGQRDFDGDGHSDILWRDSTGKVAMWLMNGSAVSSAASLGSVTTNWSVVGTGDFNGDGKADMLWRDTSGNTVLWLMNGSALSSSVALPPPATNWFAAGVADFDGDGKVDIVWRNTSGDTVLWLMNGGSIASSSANLNIATSWSIVGTGDFNGDGKADILWRDTGGNVAMWLMNGVNIATNAPIGNVPVAWSVAQTGDYDGDGKSDIAWRDSSGNVALWLMNGSAVSSTAGLGNVATTWTLQGANAD